MSAAIPFEAFYDLTLVTDLALSPAGDRLAFVAAEFDPDADERRRSLFVAPTDGSRDPHRLTRAADAGGPRWSPDGSKLGFVAARENDLALSVGRDGTDDEAEVDDETTGEEAESEDEEPRPQLWVFDLERGGDARQVTDREEGVRGFDWGPAGERVVVAARDPTEDEREYLDERREGGPIVTERLQHKFDGEGWLDSVRTYLFVVDLETRESERLDDAYGGGAFEPFLGLQPRWGTERIAFLSNRTETPDDNPVMDVYAIRPDGSDLRRITDGDVVAAEPAWAPDGERLAFGARDPENWCIPAEVAVGNAETGGYRSLTADLDRTLTRERTVRWLDDGTLVAPVADEATTRLLRVDAQSGDHEWVFDRLGNYRTIAGFDLRGGTVALALSSPGDGLDVHAMDADALDADAGPDDPDPLTRVSAANDALLDEHPMPDCRRISFESEGHDLDGIVYVPPEFDPADPEPRPLVVSIHGGPISYDAPEFSFEYAAWTSRGYVVFCPNYRGGSSYGRAFAETLHGEWGTVEVTDVVAGVEDLVERGWADPDRVFGRGFSYGGIAQGHLVAQTDLFAAAAPEHGIYDVRAEFGTGDAHVWQSREFGLPWENPGAYDAASSITDVGNVDTPLLVTAGGEDWRCPPSQSEQLYVSVKKQGVPAKLVVYPDEHHDIGDPDRAIHRLEQLEDWYATHDPGRE